MSKKAIANTVLVSTLAAAVAYVSMAAFAGRDPVREAMLTGEEHCGRLTLDGHLDPTCGCYEEGYGQGKKKLEMELEVWRPGTHLPVCGCRPCRLFRSWVDLEGHVA